MYVHNKNNEFILTSLFPHIILRYTYIHLYLDIYTYIIVEYISKTNFSMIYTGCSLNLHQLINKELK